MPFFQQRQARWQHADVQRANRKDDKVISPEPGPGRNNTRQNPRAEKSQTNHQLERGTDVRSFFFALSFRRVGEEKEN